MSARAELATMARKVPSSMVEATTRALELAQRPVRAAFLSRALNALIRLADALPERALSSAAGAATDYDALLGALADPQAADVFRDLSPLTSAYVRGVRAKRQILEAEGGVVTAAEAAQLLGISRQAVDRRRRLGQLIGLTAGRRGYLYPVWQFTEKGAFPGLKEVLKELKGWDPWVQAAFILNTNTRLAGHTPLSLLRQGRPETVARAARLYGEQGGA